MRRFTMLLLALLVLGAAGQAQAETEGVNVYVERGALAEETAKQLLQLLEREFEETAFTLLFEDDETTLRSMVLADQAPELAICAPQTAAQWAKEGLTLSLEGCVADRVHMQKQVLDACSIDGELFMAPLLARHRLLAVNRALLEEYAVGTLLDTREHPVWLPLELHQVLEECAFMGVTGMEIWPTQMETVGGIEAFVQALYGGVMLDEDGRCVANDGPAVEAVRWLRDRVTAGMIGLAEDRETALDRFMNGETALFIDWTAAEDALLEGSDLDILTMPHPSSTGLPMRSVEVTGIAGFAAGDAARDEQTKEMIAFLLEDIQAQIILGGRKVWEDGAVWLTPLGADGTAAALRSAFCDAMNAVIDGNQSPWQAMSALQQAMDGR